MILKSYLKSLNILYQLIFFFMNMNLVDCVFPIKLMAEISKWEGRINLIILTKFQMMSDFFFQIIQ